MSNTGGKRLSSSVLQLVPSPRLISFLCNQLFGLFFFFFSHGLVIWFLIFINAPLIILKVAASKHSLISEIGYLVLSLPLFPF